MKKYLKTVIFWLLVFFGMLAVSAHPVLADVFVFGSLDNYTPVVLPNGSYVHQGENISQGDYYDLSGIYGWSGILANWNDDYDYAGITNPDHTVILRPATLYSTYIDPSIFPVGKWYQFDGGVGCYGGTTTTSNNGGTILGYTSPTPTYSEADLCTNGFGNGNAFVFQVVAPPAMSQQERTVIYTSNITISQNGTDIRIPVTYTQVQTYYGTPEPTINSSTSGTIEIPTPLPTAPPASAQPVNPDVQDQNGIPINGGVSGATVVTEKSPVPIGVLVLAVLASLVVMRQKK